MYAFFYELYPKNIKAYLKLAYVYYANYFIPNLYLKYVFIKLFMFTCLPFTFYCFNFVYIISIIVYYTCLPDKVLWELPWTIYCLIFDIVGLRLCWFFRGDVDKVC